MVRSKLIPIGRFSKGGDQRGSLFSGGKTLIAYTIAPLTRSEGHVLSRHNEWNPLILFVLLGILVFVVAVQIVVIYTYSASAIADGTTFMGNSIGGFNVMGHGAGSFFAGWIPITPPPRINLNSLLNRNVPSITTNLKIFRSELNAKRVNSLLNNESSRPRSLLETKSGMGGRRTLLERNGGDPGNRTELVTPATDCPDVPDGLSGKIFPHDLEKGEHEENFTERWILNRCPSLKLGGQWTPKSCLPRHRVAIIIPFRDRAQHLRVLLAHLHPLLQKQLIAYKIYLVEQKGNLTFNKARIMNIGFMEALRDNPRWGCFIFHDVDLVPEDDRNMYSCPEQPRHMSPAIDEMNYQIPYEELVGGVLAIKTEHFFLVNGYSNLYWGWGAEDDDIANRIEHVGLKITRPPPQIARYRMIKHKKRPAVDARVRYRLLLTGVRRYKIDGLNSLSSLNYSILSVTEKPLYTHILVDIGKPPLGF